MVSCLVVAVLHVAKKTRMGMIVSIAADTSVDCNLYTCIPFDGISFYMPVCQLWHLIVSLLMTWDVGLAYFSTCKAIPVHGEDIGCLHIALAYIFISVWGNQWFSSQMPVYHKECLLGYSYPSCDECVLAIIMSANMLGRPAWDRASALDTLSCQNVTNVSQVKDVVFSLIWHRWSMILSHSAVWEWCRHCGLSWS